jgi:hypothetical protein
MKRCSQCEFIYEDDQSVCDMDGQTLTPDCAFPVLSSLSALPEKPAPIATPSSLRGIALPAGTGLLMALLFSVGFYASADTVQPASEAPIPQVSNPPLSVSVEAGSPFSFAEASVSAPSQTSLTASEPEENAAQARDTVRETGKRAHVGRDAFAIARSVPPLPRVRPLPRLPSARPVDRDSANISVVRSSTPAQSGKFNTEAAPKKADSKVGGFLKKTGRFLSKPFKR